MTINQQRFTDIVSPVDLLILTNGPGEVATWVRPVVKALRTVLGEDREKIRISVILSPCPHASGQEENVLRSYKEVDRVQASEHFLKFLLWGKTAENWDWSKRGVVIFLGGDQFFSLMISKRLGYRTVIYAEWAALWVSYQDCYAARNTLVLEQVASPYRHKVHVVGDLMVDLDSHQIPYNAQSPIIGLMVGSKSHKLAVGVPFSLAIAQTLHSLQPHTEFIIPLAPTVTLEMITHYASEAHNPLLRKIKGLPAQLVQSDEPYLETPAGLKIRLVTSFPAYDFLLQCSLVITTVGANTAELAALGIPMWILVPTQQIDIMRTWQGIPGILSRLPILGKGFATLINHWLLRQKKLYGWPNIWSKQEIVPERIGPVTPEEIAQEISSYVQNPEQLEIIRSKLLKYRGNPGAALKLAHLVEQQLEVD